MAGLPWIELHASLPRHPKSVQLGLVLGDERAWTYMAQLWLWCAESCPTGRIAKTLNKQVLECAAGWRGEPGKFVGAAIEVGFVDETEDGLVMHGWTERAAAHLAKLERDADRQRKRYETIKKRFSAKPHAENARRNDGELAEKEEVSESSPRDSHRNSNPNPNPNLLPSEEERPTTPLPNLPDDRFASGSAYFAWLQHERHAEGFVTEKPPHPNDLGAFWSEVMLEFNGEGELLDAAVAKWAADPYWRERGLPFRGLMKQWRSYAPKRRAAS